MIKFLVVIGCIPLYPIHLISRWYESETTYGKSFNFKYETKQYWKDCKESLAYRAND